MNLGIPDPMAMWHWVNDMNSGCGKIEDFPGHAPFKGSNILSKPFSSGTCIEPLTGEGLINPDIEVSLFSRYGVILTVECDADLAVSRWRQAQRMDFLTHAIETVDQKLFMHTGAGFRNMFGGLEFRLVKRYVGDVAKAANRRLIEVSGPDHLIFDNNIIHELGHIAEQRTQFLQNGMADVASAPDIVGGNGTWLPNRYSLGPGLGGGPDESLETIADVFMFWAMDSWYAPNSVDAMIAKQFIEGTDPSGVEVSGQARHSPGIAFWARMVGQYFTSGHLPVVSAYVQQAASN